MAKKLLFTFHECLPAENLGNLENTEKGIETFL